MNVFISYSRKDAAFVERLKTALEAGKIGVAIDTESLAFGDNLHEFVERSVRETDLTVAVISRQSLQSVWVIAEALETLIYEKVQRRKKYLPIYIDTSFLDDSLYLQIVEQIDASLATLKNLTVQGMERHLGTAHLDQKRERFITLRNNLPTILKKLADVLVADFSSEAKFTENLPKLLEAIAEAETQREQVSGRPSRYLAPFQAPPLPGHFVPRPEVTETLKARLLNTTSTNPGILVVSAIHGLGGIGKSTLAAALSYDKEIQQRFPDGILWHTLGQQPEILSMLSAWIQTMRDYDFRPTTVEAASTHLRTLLQDKAVLLVVDDVWNPKHAIHFKVGGPRCQVLITTRRADVAVEVGAELHQMDVMTPEQSLQLLSARLNRPIDATEHEEALALARAVGYLPLALELAAVRVARGMSWNALQQALEQEAAHLEALEGSARRRRKGETRLEACFNLSLNALRTDDEDAWKCFVWLGVLPEDTQIAAPMAVTLWDVTREEAADILELLWNDALLMPGAPILIGDQEWPSYRLHDILHDIACKLLTTNQPQGLGLTLQNAHAALLERYKQRTQDDLWHTLPDDGYIHAHLTWHFQQAGQSEQIHALLREETEDGCNGWFQVRETMGQTAGFLADVTFAMQASTENANIGLQCRYFLILASFNSLVENIPAVLLVALVQHGIWSPSQGLAYARQNTKLREQVDILVELIPCLPQTLRNIALQEALTMAQIFKDEYYRPKALTELAPHLSDPLRMTTLIEGLQAAQAIKDEYYRTKALTELAPHLPKALRTTTLAEALQAAQAIKNEFYRAQALTELAQYLPEPLRTETLSEALRAIHAIESGSSRREALAGLTPHLPQHLLNEALRAVQSFEYEFERADALTRLASYLPQNLLKEAFQAAQAIKNEGDRARALIGLAPHLPKDLLEEAFQAARDLKKEDDRAQVLAGLTPHLPKALRTATLAEAFQAAQAIKDELYRAQALAGLAPHLPEYLLREALQAAQAIKSETCCTRALTGLAPYLPQHLLSEALQTAKTFDLGFYRRWALIELLPYVPKAMLVETLRAAQAIEIKDEDDRVHVLAKLTPHLPKHLLKEALQAAQAIKYGYSRVIVLNQLASHLPHPLQTVTLEKVLRTVQTIGESDRARALISLVPNLPESLLIEALQAAQVIRYEEYRAEALTGMTPHLPKPLRTTALEAALQAAQAIKDELKRANALTRLAPHLPEHLLREALQAAQAIKGEHSRANALTGLAPHLSKQLLREALQVAQAIKYELYRTRALAGLSPYLPKALRTATLAEALQAAQAIKDDHLSFRAWALEELMPHLPGDLALQVAQAIKYEDQRARVLYVLVPHLPRDLALQVAQTIKDGVYRARALAGLVPHLPGDLALQVAQTIKDECYRAQALIGLMPHLSEHLQREALQVAQTIKKDHHRALVLAGLVPHLSEHLQREALQVAQTMNERKALITLALRLSEVLPATDLLPIWHDLLEGFARHTRKDVLADLQALTPVIFKLGGQEAIVELFHAIQDVGRWWP